MDAEWKTLQPENSGRGGQGSAYPSQQPLPVSASGMFVSLQYKAAKVERNSVIATEMFNGDQAIVITAVKLYCKHGNHVFNINCISVIQIFS